MNKSADIDRIFAHIGAPEMKYHEFEPAPDMDQARSNWSLLHSATGTAENEGARLAQPRPAAPEQRAEAFREHVARHVAEPPRVVPSPHPEPPASASQAGERPLQQVFARVAGQPVAPVPRAEAPVEQSKPTPLSQVFKRLT